MLKMTDSIKYLLIFFGLNVIFSQMGLLCLDFFLYFSIWLFFGTFARLKIMPDMLSNLVP